MTRLTHVGSQRSITSTSQSKRLHFGAGDPLSKGHHRYDEHSGQKESDLERYANEGPGVDLQPSEDKLAGSYNVPDDEVNRTVDSRERKQTERYLKG